MSGNLKLVDEDLERELDPEETFKLQGTIFNKKRNMIQSVHDGDCCAECWMAYYNCLCSHD